MKKETFPLILSLIGITIFLVDVIAWFLDWVSSENALALASTGALIAVMGNVMHTRARHR